MKNDTLNLKNKNPKKHTAATDIILALCFIVSSLYIPISLCMPLGEWLTLAAALAVGVLCIAALTRAAGSFRSVAGFSVTVAILAFFGGAFLPLALFVSFVGASVMYACLADRAKRWLVYPLPLIPATAAFFISGGVWGTLICLTTAVCGLMLWHCTRKKLDRAQAICRISVALCACAMLLICIAVYYRSGNISADAFKALVDEARLQSELMLTDVLSSMQSALGSQLGSFDSASIISALVASVFNLLPAIIITAANIVSYLAHSLWLSVKYTTAEDKKQALPQLALNITPVSAVVYITALVLSLVLTDGASALYGAAAENMLVILCPGLTLTALAGIRALTSAKGPSCLGTLLYFGLIFALASLSPIVILATAFVGAVLILISTFSAKKKDSNR